MHSLALNGESILTLPKLFARTHESSLLFSATSVSQLRTVLSNPPEVLVTGRANVGKSMLLNAVLGRSTSNPLVKSSKRAGKTRNLDFFSVGPQPAKLVLVDSPGYGSRGRPEWGELWESYVRDRKELRRIYVLINGPHGVTNADILILEMLHDMFLDRASKSMPFTLQAVITKIDALQSSQGHDHIGSIQKKIFHAASSCLPPIWTSAVKPQLGIENLRKSMAELTGSS